MRAREENEGRASFTGAAGALAVRARRIARLEARLALAETREKLGQLGLAAAAGLTGVALAAAGGAFLLAASAAALALVLPTWAALLVVAGILLTAAIASLAVSAAALRRGSPPVPRAAIDEARSTLEVVTADGRR